MGLFSSRAVGTRTQHRTAQQPEQSAYNS
ncbi:hypothetical protein M5D96_004563 [Drosophila gunungcola]|uniref:Uncharacterized protein n=1 Tax=Drosophila gunungcola TaxID=103775 RepID=A0A9Q0BT62_9MUSC|nr:hypothetical protein M5D96_004563 [Drosophila gunungcola]